MRRISNLTIEYRDTGLVSVFGIEEVSARYYVIEPIQSGGETVYFKREDISPVCLKLIRHDYTERAEGLAIIFPEDGKDYLYFLHYSSLFGKEDKLIRDIIGIYDLATRENEVKKYHSLDKRCLSLFASDGIIIDKIPQGERIDLEIYPKTMECFVGVPCINPEYDSRWSMHLFECSEIPWGHGRPMTTAESLLSSLIGGGGDVTGTVEPQGAEPNGLDLGDIVSGKTTRNQRELSAF